MSEQKIEWIDAWDCKHTMSIEAATEVLKGLYDEWPDTFDEIDSCINHWRNLAISLEEELNKEIE